MNNLTADAPAKRGFKTSWLLIIILILALVVLSFVFAGSIQNKVAGLPDRADNQRLSVDSRLYTDDQRKKIEGEDNVWNVFGNPAAPVVIVEFGDFTCPYCEQDFPIVRAMMLANQDKVRFIYRDRTPTQRSLVLALLAQCAGAQDKFWPMHDKLFQNQSDQLGAEAADLFNLAQSINLDLDKLKICLQKQTYLDRVKRSLQDSIDLNVSGTPTFFINGQKYEGTLSADDFTAIIKELTN